MRLIYRRRWRGDVGELDDDYRGDRIDSELELVATGRIG